MTAPYELRIGDALRLLLDVPNGTVVRWSTRPIVLVSWCGNNVSSDDAHKRLSKRAAISTPLPFRDILIAIARTDTP